jgi:1-phosphofructokinase family hexose kinase
VNSEVGRPTRISGPTAITCLALSVSLDITYVVEKYQLDEIHRPTEILRLPGGKALNVARAARELGAAVDVIGVVGGFTGQLIRSLLGDIPASFISDNPETRSCVSVASTSDGTLTEIYERAAPIGEHTWIELENRVDGLEPRPGNWLVLSGSVPTGVPLDRLAAVLLRAGERGFRVAVDSHGPALAAVLPAAELVKVNRAEAAELLGGDSSIELGDLVSGIRAKMEVPSPTVIVTDGIDGVIALEGERLDSSGLVRLAGDSERGAFPVGSGDCFLAGFLTALDRGEPLRGALIAASACASANARQPGAALFDLAEVDRAKSRIVALPLG